MLELTSKQNMATAARTMAESYQLVLHRGGLFIPAHWETEVPGLYDPDLQIWLPLSRSDIRDLGNMANMLFASDSEISNFVLMLEQLSTNVEASDQELLVRTTQGLRALTDDGKLVQPGKKFHPNTLIPTLNDDPALKAEIFGVISGWLNSDEEATSLLHHLATALSPGWSAVKYVLLIGDGRNGKSVLLSMLADLFSLRNMTNVTRQQMAERLPVVAELNNKLLNIVFDGEMTYVRDSSVEKTLTAGEPAVTRMLYANGNTIVQTNALFIEALNAEPKSRDKSGALQKRLARYYFPNVYALDKDFEEHMRNPEMSGAFLALLLDHYVKRGELAEKLKPTKGSEALQVEQTTLNSPVHQFLTHLITNDPSFLDKVGAVPMDLDPLVDSFMAWRVSEGYSEYSTADVKKMFKENFYTDWTSSRIAGKVVRRQRIVLPKSSTEMLLNQLKGETDGQPDDPSLVEE